MSSSPLSPPTDKSSVRYCECRLIPTKFEKPFDRFIYNSMRTLRGRGLLIVEIIVLFRRHSKIPFGHMKLSTRFNSVTRYIYALECVTCGRCERKTVVWWSFGSSTTCVITHSKGNDNRTRVAGVRLSRDQHRVLRRRVSEALPPYPHPFSNFFFGGPQ